MNDLLTHLLPLAIGAAVSPLLLVIQILVLSGKNKPISRAVGVAVGAGVMLLGLSLAFLTLLSGFGQTPAGVKPDDVTEGLRIATSILLVVLGFRNLAQRGRPPNTARAEKLADAKWRAFVAVGLITQSCSSSPCCRYYSPWLSRSRWARTPANSSQSCICSSPNTTR